MGQNYGRMMSSDPAGATPRRQSRRGFVKTQAERDAEYRRALGLDPDTGRPGAPAERLPGQIGTQSSAGGSRGGRGASQKGKGKQS